MNLIEVFVMMDDSNKDQIMYDTTYLFEDEKGKRYVYSIQFHSGMHIDDFKSFFDACAEKMRRIMPYEVEDDRAKEMN